MAQPLPELPENEILSLIANLRHEFTTTYAASDPTVYDEKDLSRIERSDDWVRMFLLHKKYSVKDAAAMMHVSLKWRKEFGVNDITEDSIPLEDREKGACYFHNKNKNDIDILMFRIRINKKGDRHWNLTSRKMIVLQLERHQREFPRSKVVALLDMTQVGLSNVDIDLTKFLITCFTTYFPGMLEYLLVYDMPWVINAVWSIVKRILSEEEQKHVIFCKKHNILQYIDADQLYLHMGGTDNTDFVYSPPQPDDLSPTDELTHSDEFLAAEQDDESPFVTLSVPSGPTASVVPDAPSDVTPTPTSGEITSGETSDSMDQVASGESALVNGHQTPKPAKRVNFSTTDEVQLYDTGAAHHVTSKQADTKDLNESYSTMSLTQYTEIDSLTSSKRHRQKELALVVVPDSELEFARTGINREASCTITISNPQIIPLAFKIKTTDPKNYRVKPSLGILRPNKSATITVILLAGMEIKRDKFLVLSAQFPDPDKLPTSTGELSGYWRSLNSNLIRQYKLRCHEELIQEFEQAEITSVTALGTAGCLDPSAPESTSSKPIRIRSPLVKSLSPSHPQVSPIHVNVLTHEVQRIRDRLNLLQDSVESLKTALYVIVAQIFAYLAYIIARDYKFI